ncbi:MAG: hypothetical protein Q7S35_03220 [Candidatus Limnocylindrales bacterium]|nr:hypothetical protein [Candidatus Limnocylindrales bacterium]
MRQQPLLSRGYEPEQPRVLVGLGVGGDDLRSIDVEALEDLADRVFAKPIGHRRVPPERPKVREHLTGALEAHLVWFGRCDRHRAVEPAPGAAEHLDGDLARIELMLEPFPGGHELGRVWPGRRYGRRSHRIEDLPQVGRAEADEIEELRDLLLVSLGPIGGRWAAGGATGVPDTAIAVAGVTVEGALTVDAAHEPDERVRAPQRRHPRVAGAPFGPDRLDAIEEDRLDRGREAGWALVLVRAALVADRAAGIERVHEDLGQSRLGEAEFVGERRVAPAA